MFSLILRNEHVQLKIYAERFDSKFQKRQFIKIMIFILFKTCCGFSQKNVSPKTLPEFKLYQAAKFYQEQRASLQFAAKLVLENSFWENNSGCVKKIVTSDMKDLRKMFLLLLETPEGPRFSQRKWNKEYDSQIFTRVTHKFNICIM